MLLQGVFFAVDDCIRCCHVVDLEMMCNSCSTSHLIKHLCDSFLSCFSSIQKEQIQKNSLKFTKVLWMNTRSGCSWVSGVFGIILFSNFPTEKANIVSLETKLFPLLILINLNEFSCEFLIHFRVWLKNSVVVHVQQWKLEVRVMSPLLLETLLAPLIL